MPYERIPSLPVHVLGSTIDLRASFLVGAALILFTAWSLAFAQKKLQVKLGVHHYALAVFLFMYLLSALLSTDLKRALTVWVFTAFTIGVGVSVGFVWQFRDSLELRKALWITTWIVLIFGFYQYLGDVIGLSTAWTGLRELYTKHIFGFPRIQSTGLEPLFYGNFLLIPFFYFTVKFLSGEEERPFFLTAVVTQLALTVSRGALIGGVVGLCLLIIMFVRQNKVNQIFGMIGIAVLGSALALLMTNVNSLSFAKAPSTTVTTTGPPVAVAAFTQATNLTPQDDRVRNRSLAQSAFEEHVLLGIGPGNFSAYAKERFEGYRSYKDSIVVNNEFFEMLAEGGILSTASLLVFVLSIMISLVRIILDKSNTTSTAWTYALVAYFIALAIQYQTFSTLYIMHVWVMLGIGMGVIAAQSTKTTRSNKKNLKKIS